MPSASIRYDTLLPPLPVLKSFQMFLVGFTAKDGVFSLVNGDFAQCSFPLFLSGIKSPITSTTFAASKISFTVDWGMRLTYVLEANQLFWMQALSFWLSMFCPFGLVASCFGFPRLVRIYYLQKTESEFPMTRFHLFRTLTFPPTRNLY